MRPSGLGAMTTSRSPPTPRSSVYWRSPSGANSIGPLAKETENRGCAAAQINSVSIDMSPAFIKGCAEHLPNACITFNEFHVIWHANAAVDRTRGIEQGARAGRS